MMKILYIIPGFGEKTKYAPYKEIQKVAKQKGYKVVPIDITWARKFMTDYVVEAREKIKRTKKGGGLYILGFSFGSFIAVELAKEFKFKKIFICSLSPFYADDIKFLPKDFIKGIWLKRIKDFKKYKFPRDLKIPAVFLFGENEYEEKEWKFAEKRMKQRFNTWKGKKTLKIVEGAGHDIQNKDYIEAIKEVI